MARYRQSGPIDFDEVQGFFGQVRGSVWDLDDFYRGGGIVPATGPNSGQVAVHQIAVDPNASSTGVSGRAETFFIHLTGSTGASTTESVGPFRFSNISIDETYISSVNTVSVIIRNFSGTDSTITEEERTSLSGLIRGDMVEVLDSSDSVILTGFISSAGNTGNSYSYQFSTATITTTFIPSPLTLRLTRISGSLDINIPTDSIAEAFVLGENLTTDTELRDNLLTSVQANTNITDHWTVSGQNRTVTINVYTDTGYTSGTMAPTASVSQIFIATSDDISTDSAFQSGSVIRYAGVLYSVGELTQISNGWFVALTVVREGFANDLTVYHLSGTQTALHPVVEFISLDNIDHTPMIAVSSRDGDLSESVLHLETDGSTGVPSEIRIDFGGVVNPQTIMMILGEQDSQGIANTITEGLDNNGELYATSGTNSVRIEDSRQRERVLPTVTVTEAGSSGLATSDFTVTEVQAGIPTERTTENLTIEYSTGDVALAAEGWNFHDGVTGDRVQITTWPTTGDLVLHIGGLEFSFAELETTLGIANINGTLRTPTFSTLTFNYNFLDLTPATSTYDISGIRTVNTGTGVALAVVLDGTTGVHSLATSDPGFENEQVVGLTFFRRPTGDINTNIPDAPDASDPFNFPPLSLDSFYNANDGSTD